MRWTLLRVVFLCLVIAGCGFWTAAQGASSYQELIQQGKTQLQTGNADRALSTARQAIKLDAMTWEGYALAGGALMNLKRYQEAADDFTQALKYAPASKGSALTDLRRQSLLAAAGVAVPPSQPATEPKVSQTEVVLWESIKNSPNLADFHAYLQQYPQGAFAALAKAKLELLSWQAIENSGNPDDFTAFLGQFPDSQYSRTAATRLALTTKQRSLATQEQREHDQDLVWTDPSTGLMWMRHDGGSVVSSREQAKNYCDRLRVMAYSNWRVPTVDELTHVATVRIIHRFGIAEMGAKLYTLNDFFQFSKAAKGLWTSTPAGRQGPYSFDGWTVVRIRTSANFGSLVVLCVRDTA